MHDRARDRRVELTAPLTVPGPPASAAAVRGPLRNAFQALDDRGIAWALLRGVEALGDRSADVDVLVDAAAMAEIDAVLRAAGFARIPASGHGSHRFYVSYDPSEDRWIDLDVVTDVAFGTRVLSIAMPHDVVVPADRATVAYESSSIVPPEGVWGHSSILRSEPARAAAYGFLRDGPAACREPWDRVGPWVGRAVSALWGVGARALGR